MENTIFSGQQAPSAAYDFRVYDKVWQRVAPGTDPYAGEALAGSAVQSETSAPQSVPSAAVQAQSAVRQAESGMSNLPGAIPDPCCMGTAAQDSTEVLEGFIQEELANSRCCLSLVCRVRNQTAAQLLRRIGSEKQTAAREMCAAYYLITGSRYTPSVTVEHRHWGSLAEALRACYHQEACNGLNYARAGDEATDLCLTKLFNRLSEEAYRRAEDVMDLLGRLIGCG